MNHISWWESSFRTQILHWIFINVNSRSEIGHTLLIICYSTSQFILQSHLVYFNPITLSIKFGFLIENKVNILWLHLFFMLRDHWYMTWWSCSTLSLGSISLVIVYNCSFWIQVTSSISIQNWRELTPVSTSVVRTFVLFSCSDFIFKYNWLKYIISTISCTADNTSLLE